jgi:uncharacterized SAM-binding protein YcdF (DUF218 family)
VRRALGERAGVARLTLSSRKRAERAKRKSCTIREVSATALDGEAGRGCGGADAIVALGCRSRTRLERRVAHGIRLYHAGAAPLLLLSGGGRDAEPEAVIMRRLALAAAVPEGALLIEPHSRNTWENACESAGLLRPRGLRRVVLVSDRTHLPRAALLFRLAGLEVAGWAGVGSPSLLSEIGAVLHELAALPKSLWRARRRPAQR